MTKNKNPLPESIDSTGSFLFSKPRSSVADTGTAHRQADMGTCQIDGPFLKVFPDIRFGNDFIAFAMAELKQCSRFAAAAVKIDDTSAKNNSEPCQPSSAICMEAAVAIDKACKSHSGIWGHLDTHRFGCFFPDMDSNTAVTAAEGIQNEFKINGNQSLSIGITVYPQINYDRLQIMDNACKALDHASFFGPSSTVVFDDVSLNISADRLYRNGDVNAAIQEFKNALKIAPSNVNVHNSLGVCYGVIGETKKALEAFESAMWLDPDEVMATYNTGYVHLIRGDVDTAIDYFYKANQIEEGLFEVTFQLGSIFLERNNFVKARPYLEAAVRNRPKSGLAHQSLGLCYKKLDRTKQAITHFKKAAKINPNDAESLSALGILYNERGENPKIASILCRQSIDISPENGLYRQRYGRVLYHACKIESALKQFEKAEFYGCDCSEYVDIIENKSKAS